jgi:hypothetical protein
MDKPDLQERWTQLTGKPAPKVSTRHPYGMAVAYELQAQGARRPVEEARQRLDGTGATRQRLGNVRPGMRLAREHGGTMHVVTIGEHGRDRWNERRMALAERSGPCDHRDPLVRSCLLRPARDAEGGMRRSSRKAIHRQIAARPRCWPPAVPPARSAARSIPGSRARRGWSRTSTRCMPSARPVLPMC